MPRKKNSRTHSADTVSVRPLATTDWPIIKQLFGDRGACGGCWCMWWRIAGPQDVAAGQG